jgi:hypothetical protein
MGMGVASVPVVALDAGLKLTTSQKDKITHIQSSFMEQRRALMPPPGEQGDGPPDQDTMRANMEKMFRLSRQASQQILAVLTTEQKKALPTVLRDIQTLRMAGIPAELLGDLKLTTDQKQKIASIQRQSQQEVRQLMTDAQQNGNFDSVRDSVERSRELAHEKALDVLTEAQRKKVEKYLQEHPQPGPGEGFGPPPGGFGPPPGDGSGPPPGGFGPPPGGPDGPPQSPDSSPMMF